MGRACHAPGVRRHAQFRHAMRRGTAPTRQAERVARHERALRGRPSVPTETVGPHEIKRLTHAASPRHAARSAGHEHGKTITDAETTCTALEPDVRRQGDDVSGCRGMARAVVARQATRWHGFAL